MCKKDIPNNLPLPLATFIGRKTEITRIIEWLGSQPPVCRLLTLTGVGGVGKTRLALEAARQLLNNFQQGVWLIKLAALSEPQLVPQTVMQALGLKSQPQCAPLETLTEYLKTRQLLLILDNCEHLIDACAALAESLLQICPEIAILATSREGLNIEGEVSFPVVALSLPDAGAVISLDQIGKAEAVQLFLQRGAAVQPDFQLTNDNAPAIIQICQRLDGLPLALELAAARLKGLPLNQLANRLNDRFKLLTTGSRTALPRHQTLQALLDWSYHLLAQREQIVFRRLSGFAGSFSLEAAEFVCQGEYQEPNGWGRIAKVEVAALLAQLVGKSLVQLEPGDQTLDEQRYRLLEIMRHYSQDRASEANETELIRRNHLDWWIELAEKAEPHLQGSEQLEWLRRLEAEHAEFRVALTWAIENEPEKALRLCGALWRFWQAHSHFIEARRWMEAALARSEGVDLQILARALHGAGVLLSFNDYAASLALHQENLNIRRELGDLAGQIVALRDLGWLALHHNDFARAKSFGEESLRLGQIQDDKANIAASLFVLSIVAFFEGDFNRSAKLDEECLQIWRELGDLGSCASTLSHLGMVAIQQADYLRAGQLLVESLDLNLELSNKLGIANTILQIARLSLALPEGTERAVRLSGWLEQMTQALGGKMPPLARLTYDTTVTTSRERLDERFFNTLWAEGHTLTLEQVIKLAREVSLPALELTKVLSDPVPSTPKSAPGGAKDLKEKLTQREVEVLRLVAMGLTNAQVAEKMVITSRTVNAHLTSIYAKLGVTSRSGAIRYALEHGLSD